MALELFGTQTWSPRNIATKTSSYTLVLTDDEVDATGSGITLTLPALDSIQGTLYQGEKLYLLKNTSALYDITVQPGTSAITGTADTIASHSVWTIKPKESILIRGYSNLTNWTIVSPTTIPALNRVPFCQVVTTSGTTAQNVFDANGAPVNVDITAVLAIATVTLAGNVVVKNGTDTALTLAKGTTAVGQVVGAAPSAVPTVAAGAVFTVAMDQASADCVVIIFGTMQTYLAQG